jgi:phosphoribosylformimino-5-aminoimidazole carboxamide ribonucleotide (ProFAR) isomerase
MHKLNFVQIAESGKTVTVGGGIKSAELIPALFAQGKYTGEQLIARIRNSANICSSWRL